MGSLTVVSGPSGVGKNTLIDEVFKRMPHLKFSQSLTTRGPRSNDVPGKYVHVSRDEFMRRVEKGDLLEWAEFAGNLYGTLVPSRADDVLLEIEVQGAGKVKAARPGAKLIGILPPGKTADERLAVLKQRLVGRDTDDEAAIDARLREAGREIEQVRRQSDVVIVNDKFDAALDELLRAIAS